MTRAKFLRKLGQWSPSKLHSGVVSTSARCGHVTGGGGEHAEQYGGYLVAESITPENIKRIVAIPKLLDALFELRELAASGSLEMSIIDAACNEAGVEPWRWPIKPTGEAA